MARFRPWVLPVVLLLLLMAVALVLGLRKPYQDPIRDHAVTRTNHWGTKALAELAGRHGVRVVPWSRPLTALRPTDRVLWLLDPSRSVPEWELRALVEWVQAGGELLVGTDLDEEHNVLSFAARGPSPDDRLLAALGLEATASGPAQGSAHPSGRRPATQDVASVLVPGPHRLQTLTAAELARRNRELRQAGGKAQLLRVFVRPAWTTLLADEAGAVLQQARCGRGRITVLSEVEVLSNENLSRADNVVLAANLLFGPGVGRVYFDEHLHRVSLGRSAEAETLDPSRARAALYLALLALALYFVGRMQRFGAPQPLTRPARRSALEFVEALADLYRRAEARGAVLEVLRHTFRQRLAMVVGLPPETPAPALAAALASHRGVAPAPLAGLLAELDDPETTTNLTEARLLRLARLMATYEEAVIHGQ